MASSNRHWPSMFKKSKPSNPNHQWQQHDTNSSHISTGSQRSPFTPGAGGDERSPEPKPRWNPKPEQIRILEAIFNSGMVNPPRDEIRKIRIQLQEYGQVGDANVFYWFQNRKSRSKHKLRHLHNSSKTKQNNPEAHQNSASNDSLPQITAPYSSSSSSSSEKSSPKEMIPIGFSNVNDGTGVPNSPSEYPSVNNQQAYFQTPNIETNFQLPPPSAEPFSFPLNGQGSQGVVANNNPMMMMTTQGFYLSHDQFSNLIQPQPEYPQNVVPFNNSMLFSEIMGYGNGTSSNNGHQEDDDQDKAMKIMHYPDPQLGFCLTSTPTVFPPIANTPTTDDVPPITDASVAVSSPIIGTQLQGVGGEADGTAKCTVFINDVAFEVAVGPFNVRQAFGDGAVFIHSSGHPVLTDEWGVTLHPLQHGASYYLI